MALPAWDASGLLPPGIHPASLDDIYERCVKDAPHSPWRETVFDALKTYLAVLRHRGLVPAGTAWIDGGFMTQKPAGPFDVDVVVHPTHWSRLNSLTDKEEAALFGALTLQDVIVGSPVLSYVPRIQPVVGALDAFICHPGEEAYWEQTWASVTDANHVVIPGAVKGFAEVSW